MDKYSRYRDSAGRLFILICKPLTPVGKGKNMRFVHTTVELLNIDKERTVIMSFTDFKQMLADGRLTRLEPNDKTQLQARTGAAATR